LPEALTSERIIEAAEDVLRRFGPQKTTVVDVARSLGVSHGAVYRHFDSKAALWDAVTARWLHRVATPLAEIAAKRTAPRKRLHDWLHALITIKKSKVRDDPAIFAAYSELAADAGPIVADHIEALTGQIARILSDGVASGVFHTTDVRSTARAIFFATARFHHPVHAADWSALDLMNDFEAIFALLMEGLARRRS
jgi:AcrR family transcriptional regulator